MIEQTLADIVAHIPGALLWLGIVYVWHVQTS